MSMKELSFLIVQVCERKTNRQVTIEKIIRVNKFFRKSNRGKFHNEKGPRAYLHTRAVAPIRKLKLYIDTFAF